MEKNKEPVRLSVIVIGSGGTGTYFLKEFSRFLSGQKDLPITKLVVVDGDTVEKKNLARQAFSEEDIGLNKAAVMADILNSSFGVCWKAFGSYITKKEELADMADSTFSVPLIIGCVDNHACRLVCEEFFNSVETCFYLDSANEFDTGEAVFAYKADGKVISPVRSHYFPEILKDTVARTEMSCEELNNAAPQHIATNMLAGNILLTEVCCLLSGKTHPGLVTFDSALFSQEFIPYGKGAVAL